MQSFILKINNLTKMRCIFTEATIFLSHDLVDLLLYSSNEQLPTIIANDSKFMNIKCVISLLTQNVKHNDCISIPFLIPDMRFLKKMGTGISEKACPEEMIRNGMPHLRSVVTRLCFFFKNTKIMSYLFRKSWLYRGHLFIQLNKASNALKMNGFASVQTFSLFHFFLKNLHEVNPTVDQS